MQVLNNVRAFAHAGAFVQVGAGADARLAVSGGLWPPATGLLVLLLAQAGTAQGLWTDF